MSKEENIRAILETNFAGFKEEIIDSAVNRLMEVTDSGPMIRYLDADKLEKDGWTMQRIRQDSPTEVVCETRKPTDFLTADVAEVKHGRWKKVNDDDSLYRCSVCGELSCCKSNYCGECGAKMDEVSQ